MLKRPRLVFLISGRGSNLGAILKQIKKKKLKANPVLVFSDKANALGLEKAAKLGIANTTFSPKDFTSFQEYEQNLVRVLQEVKAEYIVCAGYMRILKDTFLQHYEGRIFNIHPSLLPSFPGLKPQRQALQHGVKVTGCTVHFVDSGLDTGRIIAQSPVFIKAKDTEETLSKRILKAEHDLYWRAIQSVI